MTSEKHLIRFWSLVDKTKECWLWNGSKYSNGYGRFGFDNKRESAHRLSYKIAFGEIKDGLFVCHKCDVHNCVNPDHLFLGTCSENLQDMVKKNRQGRPDRSGKRNGRAKLDENIISQMKNEYSLGKISYRKLGSKYGVCETTARYAVLDKSWSKTNG